jgi:hypothetical protein
LPPHPATRLGLGAGRYQDGQHKGEGKSGKNLAHRIDPAVAMV